MLPSPSDAPPFRVWAPRARQVEVELVKTGERVPMVAEAEGYFSLPAAPVSEGGYQLRLDGGPPIPDPRADDVESIAGPSHRVDHSSFTWTDRSHPWPSLEGAVLYELHVGTFTREGTFDGALHRLPELRALGVTHVELMPVAAFSGKRGWGYDGAALFAPHRAYGGVEGLKRFVDGAHAIGLGVILDVVYNHLGPIGNYLSAFGPYFQHDRQTPWGAAVNFDGAHSSEVRRFFIDNALHWLTHYHLDGLRLDAVHAIHDESAIPFLEQLGTEVHALGRPALLIAESDLNDPRIVRSRAEHGFGLDAQWSDDLHHALHVTLTGETHGYYADFADPLPALARALDEGFVYQGQHSAHRKRAHGRPLGRVPLNRLVAFAQNHDQIGNRAYGERLHHVGSVKRSRAALALLMLSPQIPMLFQGEEWAASTPFQYFTDHEDPKVAVATTEGRLREFGGSKAPDPQDEQTFLRSRLDWEEREKPEHRQMLQFTRELIALRRSSRELISAAPGRAAVDAARRVLTYERGPFFFALNLGDRIARVSFPHSGTWASALTTAHGAVLDGAGIELSPEAFAVMRR